MASTSLDIEAASLVSHPLGEAAKTVGRPGGLATHSRNDRQKPMLKHLQRIVACACPPYLRKDQDDVIQTVLIRLDDKLGEIVDSLRTCHDLLRQGGPASRLETATALGNCLAEIGKACDRQHTRGVSAELDSCLSRIRQNDDRPPCEKVLRSLEKCRTWFQNQELKEVFAETYAKKSIHWAILDARKKHLRLAEVPPEEREDGSTHWGGTATTVPEHRSLVIREALSDCLSRLDEGKRRPTYLALLGYVYGEIAEYLDLSLPQTDSRIRRGREFLRNCLKSKGVSP